MRQLPGLSRILFAGALGLSWVFTATPLLRGATVLDDTFADGNSQNQDLANNSVWLFNGRAANTRTDAAGSVTFTMGSSSSEGLWAFFTESGSPVELEVGDQLTASMTLSVTGLVGTGQDIRGGLFNSGGTRNTANKTGGMNDSTFGDDYAYGFQFYASGSGSPFVAYERLDPGSTANAANPFNTFGTTDWTPLTTDASGATERSTIENGVSYTIAYSVLRATATDTVVSVAVTGGSLPTGFSWVATDTSGPVTSFDCVAIRFGGTAFCASMTVTEVKVEVAPAAPTITAQPNPTTLTVAVGSDVSMTVGASGSSLAYQWKVDGVAIDSTANASAATATLALTNLQTSDSGSYACTISNDGGEVTSDVVSLTVTTGTVDPAPVIDTQPADTSVVLGQPGQLTVVATGNDLSYQWYKDDVLMPGEIAATLSFGAVAVSDRATYHVVVANSGGNVTSADATLTVLSPMTVSSLDPVTDATGVCIDAPLSITFSQAPVVGSTGSIIVRDAADDSVVDTIDLGLSAQTKVIGGTTFNYRPVLVSGNTATIILHSSTTLAYNKTYYVTIDTGAIEDADGAWFEGVSDTTAWRFSTKAEGPATGTAALTVAADGSGDFCTVQGAIDFVPSSNTERVVVTVMNGTYTEIVHVPSGKDMVTIRGESRDGAIIAYANNNTFNSAGTAYRPMFGMDADDFVLETITLHNTTPKGGSQAEAFRTGNSVERCLVNRVSLYSYQDTILAGGQTFFNECYIEGDVDYMWGYGANFYQRCELKTLTSGGYLTQIRNGSSGNGNVYVGCTLTAADGVSGVYLSRIDPGVFPYSQVMWINCAMSSAIRAEGWLLNNASSAPNVQFWEYKSTDLDGALLDVSSRLADSHQMSDEEAEYWSDPLNVLGWVPTIAPVIEAGPSDVTVNPDDSIVLVVTATGTPTPTYRWFHDGVEISGASEATLTIASATSDDAGIYLVQVSNDGGTVEASATVVVSAASVTIGGADSSVTAGGALTLSADLHGVTAVSYQWQLDGVDIEGATDATYTVSSTQHYHAGSYTVVVTVAGGGTLTSVAAEVGVDAPAANAARLMNISTRASCGTGDTVLITGFVIRGTGSKRLLIRTVGPELAAYGVSSTMPDPQMVLKQKVDNAYVDIDSNGDWGDNANAADIVSTAAAVYAFALTDGSTSAALLVDLPAGEYTVVGSDATGATGIGIIEVYDADTDTPTATLVNISTRGLVGTGNGIMIPGFIVSEEGSKTVLIRAVGPGLAGYGVAGTLADPQVSIYRRDYDGTSDVRILANDNWGENDDAAYTAQVAADVYAFALDEGSADAALVVSLTPGIYTIHASGVGGTSGVALLEVYLVE